MPSPLTALAAEHGHKPAVIDDRPGGAVTIWSFAELNRQTNRLAHALLSLGIRPGDKVVWCGQNSPGIVRAMHALSKLGATAVPLNYRLSPEEATYVVDNSDALAVYVDAEFAPLFSRIAPAIPQVRHVVVFDGRPGPGMLDGDALERNASDAEPPVENTGEYPSSMLYTSGTTGRPKGAVRPNLDPDVIRPLLELVGHQADDVYLTTGPLYHSGPGGYLGLAHRLGNTAVIQRKFDPEDWLRLVHRYRVSTTFSAPTPIRMVCALPAEVKARYDCSSMRRMIANAAPWSYALKEAYMADFGEDSLWEVYGSTELGVDTVLAPADQRRKPGSCGRAAPGVEIVLLDDEGREIIKPDTPGEVFVRSAGNFAGYYKILSSEARGPHPGFSSVGDIAYRDEEGYYYICDRKSDMIISGGMNIYPAEIEATLERHPDILEVAVFGIPSDQWGESVHAVVVPRTGASPSAEAVIAFAREHLAGYKLPRSISFAPELPRTGSGKTLKRVLREPFWQGRRTRVS